MICYTISYNILYKTNSFPMAKVKVILLLVKSINKKKSPYTDALDKRDLALNKRDPASINKVTKMSRRIENIKI